MSTLTPELNLVQGEDNDDTADYLTSDLADSLAIIDGLFNNSTGHTHSGAHQGGLLGAGAFPDNTIPGAKLVDLSVYGAKIAAATITADKLAAGIIEALFSGTWITRSADYVVAAPIMFVFCTSGVTVTLPAAGSTNRPITVVAVSGQSAITAASGSVIGGSINTSSGAVMNGTCSQGDSLTYKSDGTNWRVV